MRHKILDSRVIVTGASSGIGRQLAFQLGTSGAKVVINARRTELLETLRQEIVEHNEARQKPSWVEIVPGDITQDIVRRAVVERAANVFDGLDILINNAGGAASGLFETGSPERLTKVMNLNVVSMVEMIRLALPLLKRHAPNSASMIVNFSSVVGIRGVTHYSEYCAAKFAVRGFSESLRTELAADGIDVLVVCPGSTDTEFFTRYIENTGEPTWPNHSRVSPQYVARSVIRAIQRGKHRVMPFFLGHIMQFLSNNTPSFMDWVMLQYSKKGK